LLYFKAVLPNCKDSDYFGVFWENSTLKIKEQDVKILNPLLILLIINLGFVGSASAAIELTNNTDSPVTLDGYPDNALIDSIIKVGTGTDIIDISLTVNGATAINEGSVQFSGETINLQNVYGGNNKPTNVGENKTLAGLSTSLSSLQVGNGIVGSHLSANYISVATLTIGAGSTVTIRSLSPMSVIVPEPTSLLIWLLIGLVASWNYLRRK
jgi:hypothetical protein